MIRSNSAPISDLKHRATVSYAPVSKSKFTKHFPSPQRHSPSATDNDLINRDVPKVCEGYVLCIPAKDSGFGGGHCIDSDDTSDISDVTWMTFRMEQLRERFRQEAAASSTLRTFQSARVGRRESDGNISKATNVGVLEVEFGSSRSSGEIDSDAYNHAGANEHSGSASRIKLNRTNADNAQKLLLENIIELKLQLAEKQATIDDLSGKCKRLRMENDHLKNRLVNSSQQAVSVHGNVDSNVKVESKKNLNDTNEMLQLLHLENEIDFTTSVDPKSSSVDCHVLESVPEHITSEVDGDNAHGDSSRYRRNIGSLGFIKKLCHKIRGSNEPRSGELLSDWGEVDTIGSGDPSLLFVPVQV
mmetsp:Transcript_16279/g.33091  ORF Transcript_16279/g.33091 Transcript_16279/m.33091 type:complete len:359 (-) Transcript_16279:171-1247(-)